MIYSSGLDQEVELKDQDVLSSCGISKIMVLFAIFDKQEADHFEASRLLRTSKCHPRPKKISKFPKVNKSKHGNKFFGDDFMAKSDYLVLRDLYNRHLRRKNNEGLKNGKIKNDETNRVFGEVISNFNALSRLKDDDSVGDTIFEDLKSIYGAMAVNSKTCTEISRCADSGELRGRQITFHQVQYLHRLATCCADVKKWEDNFLRSFVRLNNRRWKIFCALVTELPSLDPEWSSYPSNTNLFARASRIYPIGVNILCSMRISGEKSKFLKFHQTTSKWLDFPISHFQEETDLKFLQKFSPLLHNSMNFYAEQNRLRHLEMGFLMLVIQGKIVGDHFVFCSKDEKIPILPWLKNVRETLNEVAKAQRRSHNIPIVLLLAVSK